MLVPGGKATMFSHWDSTWMISVKGTLNTEIFTRFFIFANSVK